MLLIFGGLPGTGKTTLSRALAHRIMAVPLRIDTIEQVLRHASLPTDQAGYEVAYQVAADNLRLGATVIADCVNPLRITRDAWREVAGLAEAPFREIELICSDTAEHRRRVESRSAHIPGLALPTWEEVIGREYDPWDRPRIVIDTSGETIAESLARLELSFAIA